MVTQDLVRKKFEYEGGKLLWKDPSKYKPSLVGKAVNSLDSKGYLRVGFGGKRHAVHRIIFLYHKGYLPDYVDHINADKLDNRIENLRGCTNEENSYNSKLSKANTSGVKGVSWSGQSKKWHVQISSGGRRVFSKMFDTIGEAKESAGEARARIHGDFARDS